MGGAWSARRLRDTIPGGADVFYTICTSVSQYAGWRSEYEYCRAERSIYHERRWLRPNPPDSESETRSQFSGIFARWQQSCLFAANRGRQKQQSIHHEARRFGADTVDAYKWQ